MSVVDAHQLCRFLVVGYGAESASEFGMVQEQLQTAHHHKDEQRPDGERCVESAEKYSTKHLGDRVHGVTFRNKLRLFLRAPPPAAGPPVPPVLPAPSKRGLRPPWPA